jgi:hypothetical protein
VSTNDEYKHLLQQTELDAGQVAKHLAAALEAARNVRDRAGAALAREERGERARDEDLDYLRDNADAVKAHAGLVMPGYLRASVADLRYAAKGED